MSFEKLADALRADSSATVETERALAPLTTYRVGGPAALFFEPSSVEDMVALARALSGLDEEVPVLALGRGSNVVVSDEGFPGVVIRLGSRFARVDAGDGDSAMLAGAATPMPTVA